VVHLLILLVYAIIAWINVRVPGALTAYVAGSQLHIQYGL
jgi:hypothetical protein